MALLGGFLKQMNDSIESNRKLLKRKITVAKIKEAYREQVMHRPSHYEHMNPEDFKLQIRKKLTRNRVFETIRHIYALGLMLLLAAAVAWVFMLVSSFTTLHAQIPQDIPHQSDPVDFTKWSNLLIYIGGPILMVVLYLWWRKKHKD